jgi:hypothetical protein
MELRDKERLKQAYTNTTFTAMTPRCEIRLRIGDSHSEMDKLLRDHGVRNWAYITAYNPASKPLDETENARRQDLLEEEILLAGYTVYRGAGIPDTDSWTPERSVLVLGIEQNSAVILAKKYGQAAIVFGSLGTLAELVWIE